MFLELNVDIEGKYEENTLEHTSLLQIFLSKKLEIQFYISVFNFCIFEFLSFCLFVFLFFFVFLSYPLSENHFAKKPLAERGGIPPPLNGKSAKKFP